MGLPLETDEESLFNSITLFTRFFFFILLFTRNKHSAQARRNFKSKAMGLHSVVLSGLYLLFKTTRSHRGIIVLLSLAQ